MVGADYLGEGFGLRLVFLMAAHAQGGDLGECRLECGGIVGMFGERAVAGLAGDVGVLALGADLRLIIVAHDAGVLAGVGNGVLADGREGAGAVVSVLAEAFGHDGAADHHENAEAGQQDQGGPDQVSGIAEESLHSFPLFARSYARAKQ